jgi:hypothetical protein
MIKINGVKSARNEKKCEIKATGNKKDEKARIYWLFVSKE